MIRRSTECEISNLKEEREELSSHTTSNFDTDGELSIQGSLDKEINKINREEMNQLSIVDDISNWIYESVSIDVMWAYFGLKLNEDIEIKKLFNNEIVKNERVFRCICASNMKKS